MKHEAQLYWFRKCTWCGEEFIIDYKVDADEFMCDYCQNRKEVLSEIESE